MGNNVVNRIELPDLKLNSPNKRMLNANFPNGNSWTYLKSYYYYLASESASKVERVGDYSCFISIREDQNTSQQFKEIRQGNNPPLH